MWFLLAFEQSSDMLLLLTATIEFRRNILIQLITLQKQLIADLCIRPMFGMF
jgi:hypothetical protein